MQKITVMLKIALLALICLDISGIAKSSLAATYYVRMDGNNNCTGLVDRAGATGGCAWSTLQQAADTVQSGDTVWVGNGTYQGFMIQSHGNPGAPIVFKAQSTGANITSPNARTNDGINIESYGTEPADYITIVGFNVDSQPRMGIRAIGGNGIIIENCTSHNNASNGIFSGDTPNIQVLNNTVYANGSSQYEHNIYLSNALSDGAVVRGNLIYGSNSGNGLQLNGDWAMGGDGFIDHALVENNVVYGNSKKGLSLISIRYGRIQNNIVYNNGLSAGGIHIVEESGRNFSTGNVVVNNTIDEPDIACVRINSENTGNVIFNNICIGSTGIVFEGAGNYQADNYTSAAATGIFADRTSHNYHLIQNSPAIGVGVSSFMSNPAPAVDFDSNARNARFDAGAYQEMDGTGPTPPGAPTGLKVQ
jgi:parallel beta-helix repeat protein